MLSFISLVLVAFSGVLVSATPVARYAYEEAFPHPHTNIYTSPHGDHSRDSSGCSSGKSYTGQTPCSPCQKEGNVVCGLDGGRNTDLTCTKVSSKLIWAPAGKSAQCITAPSANPRTGSSKKSGCKTVTKFTSEAGCSTCSKVGNIVCGRDEDRTTELKCTKFSDTMIQWIPIDNAEKCGVFTPPKTTTTTKD